MSYLEGHLCLSVDDLLASLALHPLAIRVTHQVIDLKQESIMMVKLQIKLHSFVFTRTNIRRRTVRL